jgi:hypothetical protein
MVLGFTGGSLTPTKTWARELFEINRSVRAMGMGNAFVSIVDSEDALFYNPAGLAKTGGFYWTIADPAVGANGTNGLDVFEAISDNFAAGLDELYKKPIWAGANAKTALMTPFFTVAYYGAADASLLAINPASPELTLNGVYDTGLALGSGFNMGLLQFGAVVKRIERTGTRRTFGASTIAGIVEGSVSSDTILESYKNTGLGYSLDLGFNIGLPTPITPNFSFVWRNVGNTSFSRDSTTGLAPPTEKQEWILGASMVADLPLISLMPTIDIKHFNDSETALGKKIHMGVELGLPLIDLRAGFHQGYLSYGLGLGLGPAQIDLASWGVELGEYPGQQEDRRYMLQLTFRLGFDLGLGMSSGRAGDTSKRAAASSSRGSFSRNKRRR